MRKSSKSYISWLWTSIQSFVSSSKCLRQLCEHKEYKQSQYQYDPFGRRLCKATEDQHYWYGWDENRLLTTETNDKRINTLYHPDSFAPLVRIEQDLPLTARVPKLGEVMEAEMGIKLPKLVTEQFNEVEEAIREDQLTDKQIQWLEGMMLTTADIKERLPKIPKQTPLLIHYYHCDHIGTPLALIRDTGEIDWKIELDPFGKVISEQGADKLYQPIRMQGQQYDEESGLHYNRYRYYDPNVGRYISQDPIGLAGGMNNYIYPLNPNQMVDPLGLEVPSYPIHPSNIPGPYYYPSPPSPQVFAPRTVSTIGNAGISVGGAADINVGVSQSQSADGSTDYCALVEICTGGGSTAGASASVLIEASNTETGTGIGSSTCITGEAAAGPGVVGSVCSNLGAAASGNTTAGSISGGVGIGAKAGVYVTQCIRVNVCASSVTNGLKKLFNKD